MPTPKFICGAECGLATAGTLGVGEEHWGSTAGTAPTVVTSGPASMRSTRCFRFNPTANNSALLHTFVTSIGSPATVVGRFYIYFATLPSANTGFFQSQTTNACDVAFKQSDSKIYPQAAGSGTFGAQGFAVTTGQWYRIDFKFVYGTTTTCDVSVDGTALTQASASGSASAFGSFQWGVLVSCSADVYMDDFIVSGTSADYPIGAGTVAGLYPNGDGSHNFTTSGEFTKTSALTAIAPSDTNTWSFLQPVPLSTTIDNNHFISDATALSSEYLEWTFDDLPAATSVNGLMAVTLNHAATATSCLAVCKLNDNGTITNIYASSDFSEITIVTAIAVFATAPSTSAAWTKTLIDGVKVRWGMSTDVSPDPILDGVCLEVDYVASAVTFMSEANLPILQAVKRASVY